MPKKTSPARRRRTSTRGQDGVRLRDEFRSFARAAILEAGEEVLAQQGLHAARMEEVARKARVAVGTIYNLLGDRDALVLEILRQRHAQLVALLADTLERDKALPYRDQGRALIAALLGYFREHSQFFKLVSESERGPACVHKQVSQATVAELRRMFERFIERGVEAGVLRPQPRTLTVALLMGFVREIIALDLDSPRGDPIEERAAQVFDLFIEGAGARV